jgi:hypothetical protein
VLDHPLDPYGKMLNHYHAVSPEMLCIYRGTAVLGPDGRAEARLPDYFSAFVRNPMVQLTGVGTPDVFVAEDIAGNRFVVGGPAGTKVYWTVTADRNDVTAQVGRIMTPVEQPKTGESAGRLRDDEGLALSMPELERMAHGGQFQIKTAKARQRYEQMQQHLREAGNQ